MTAQRKQTLKYWGDFAATVLAIIALIGVIWQGGQLTERIEAKLDSVVTVEDMKDWVAETRQQSTNWNPANFLSIWKNNHRD